MAQFIFLNLRVTINEILNLTFLRKSYQLLITKRVNRTNNYMKCNENYLSTNTMFFILRIYRVIFQVIFVCISKIELESVHFSYVNDFALDVNMHGERWKLITIKDVLRK